MKRKTIAWKWCKEEDHCSKTNRSHEYVGQKKAEGPTIHEGGCSSEEETGTDDTTETRNEVSWRVERWRDIRGGIHT